MKKSIAILGSLAILGTTTSAVAGDEEPSHTGRVIASEDRESYTSRSDEREPLSSLADEKTEASISLQAEAAQQAAEANERKEREREAARRAAAEAARKRAAAERVAEAERAEKARQKKQEQRKKRTRTPERPVKSAPSGNIKQYAAGLVGAGQFSCLEALWNRESGWNHLAQNPSSGAYGIPQALPGSKMASAGSDWQTNPYTQVRWGVSYIKSRYGTPCNAWAHSQSVGWY